MLDIFICFCAYELMTVKVKYLQQKTILNWFKWKQKHTHQQLGILDNIAIALGRNKSNKKVE